MDNDYVFVFLFSGLFFFFVLPHSFALKEEWIGRNSDLFSEVTSVRGNPVSLATILATRGLQKAPWQRPMPARVLFFTASVLNTGLLGKKIWLFGIALCVCVCVCINVEGEGTCLGGLHPRSLPPIFSRT